MGEREEEKNFLWKIKFQVLTSIGPNMMERKEKN